VIPGQCTPRINARKKNRTFLMNTTTMDYSNYDHDARIELAMADMDAEESPVIAEVAKRWGLSRSTLSRRWNGITASRKEATSLYHQRLTTAQEEVLIDQINKLTIRKMPPTSQIVRNIAEEIIKGAVGKNWTLQFVKRHGDRLTSLYLRNIDNIRAKSEYPPMFVLFYQLVRVILHCCYAFNIDLKKIADLSFVL
jgi:transposase-like protein